GGKGEAELLAGCYRNPILIAKEKGLKSIAFPAISTGVYGYPKKEAAEIAVRTICAAEKDFHEDFTVFLMAFDVETEEIYRQVL
ncbi:MAG: macro domain-containing protein, partial [Phascolarctobacterium sp.]|nr:macro domain-containing protein [Phascolarctobacterium sp.]